MDLRRSVLTKQNNVLCESSLNISGTSAYDSAVDDSDASLYYSFTNESTCSTESQGSNRDDNDFGNQSSSSDADKENTVIMRKRASPVDGSKTVHEWEKHSVEFSLEKTEEVAVVDQQDVDMPEKLIESIPKTERISKEDIAVLSSSPKAINLQENDVELRLAQKSVGPLEVIHEPVSVALKLSLIEEDDEMTESSKKLCKEIADAKDAVKLVDVAVTAKPVELIEILNLPKDEKVSEYVPEMPLHLLSQVESPYGKREENVLAAVEIVIQDPNENIINPFTATVNSPVLAPQPEKRATRRSITNTMIPGKAGYYSPVLRKSLERKVKLTNKPQNMRRTLYGAMKVPVQSKPKTPTQIPQPTTAKPVAAKPLLRPAVKPKLYKCSETGCSVEVTSARALQEHLKQHTAPTNPASLSLVCKYCDKKFQLEAALLNHQTEKCTRVPFNEKRKLLAQRDKKEKDRRGTALFTMPAQKRKSPSRRQSTAPKLNKSGIMITPKKSLKCHICKAIVPDALSFTNHILAHKFNKQINEQA